MSVMTIGVAEIFVGRSRDAKGRNRIRMIATKKNIKDIVELYSENVNNYSILYKTYLKKFLKKNLNKITFVSVKYNNNKLVSMATMTIYNYPPNPYLYRGKTTKCAFITNVYTRVDSRHNGYATECIKELLVKAKDINVAYIHMNAVKSVAQLYKSLGFKEDSETTFLEKYIK